MKFFSHLSAWVQKNHDICLFGSLVFLPLCLVFLSRFTVSIIELFFLVTISGLTLHGKLNAQRTSRVAPTEKLWFAVFGSSLAALFFSFYIQRFAFFTICLLLPLVFFTVLYDRQFRFDMAKLRIAKRRAQQSRWRLSKRAVLSEWKERLRWLAGVQHDMRQPLYALGLLVAHPTLAKDKNAQEVVQQMMTCQKWLFELAENTLEATRLELGEQRAHQIEAVSSGELCSSLEAWMRNLAESKGLIFKVDVDEHFIHTDARRLKRVMGNLVFNAVEHTYEGSVSLSYKRQGGVHCFTVADTGPGLNADLLTCSSSPSSFGSSDLPKTGIGLYVVKRLCKEMGWGISLTNAPEHNGTTFVLEFADRLPSKVEQAEMEPAKKAMG
jgi:signal transduction histidine kinase